jgi:hypothetical protein
VSGGRRGDGRKSARGSVGAEAGHAATSLAIRSPAEPNDAGGF